MQPLEYSHDPASEVRTQANAWVARFAPLVMDNSAATAQVVRNRLGLVNELRRGGGGLRMRP